eukprot:m.106658 g.106658  ORF g.106658 m.106658 type:complete len:464 (+) comp15159_c1_seq1:209-1600(+)
MNDNVNNNSIVYLGCVSVPMRSWLPAASDTLEDLQQWQTCQQTCHGQGLSLFTVARAESDHRFQCSCFHGLPLQSQQCQQDGNYRPCSTFPCLSDVSQLHVYHIGHFPRLPRVHPVWEQGVDASSSTAHINVFLFVHDRLGSLWHTCRLTSYSTKHEYHIYDMRFQLSAQEIMFKVLPALPGPKLIVLNACCVDGDVLLNWPSQSVLIIAGDESARWGFSQPNGRTFWGPHGSNGPLPSDEQQNMIVPEAANPWFKQYYSHKHVQVYGGQVHFLPLGSRAEFPDAQRSQIPAPQRKYIYSFMGAPTNEIRRYFIEVMQQDKLIPKDKVFLHLTEHWSPTPNDPRTDYINSTAYAAIMRDSAFTPCPKGHSVEQFRIYEAIESGSIPVICYEQNYVREYLPPEMIHSPIVFVHTWEEAAEKMMSLYQNPAALLSRQIALVTWYDDYMRARVSDVESILEQKMSE